jgi:putative flippase GtrA
MVKRELIIFLFVGSLTVLIDFLCYRGLVWIDLLGINAAKGISFITGTIFAYFANRLWTFKHKGPRLSSAWRFGLLYSLTLATNIFANAVTLIWLASIPSAIQIAFLVATGISAILNFLGLKYFVFRYNRSSG